jgi:hypothetical protein
MRGFGQGQCHALTRFVRRRRTSVRCSPALSVAFLTAAIAVLPGPADAAFAFRKPLVVQGSRIMGGPHTDHPVLINIIDPNLRTVAFGGNVRSASGFDIEFRASDLVTILDHEIEQYAPSTGALVAWVRLPTMTNGTNVTIHAYYGDPSVTCARNNPRQVWDANYRYVYHVGESGGANPADSTSEHGARLPQPHRRWRHRQCLHDRRLDRFRSRPPVGACRSSRGSVPRHDPHPSAHR